MSSSPTPPTGPDPDQPTAFEFKAAPRPAPGSVPPAPAPSVPAPPRPEPPPGWPGSSTPPKQEKPDYKDLFPYLNPPQWEGKSSCLCRPLMDETRMPSVSFGRDLLHGIGMIMLRTACEEGITVAKVEPIAIQNLAARPDRPEWQSDEVEWQGTMRTLFYRMGDERTASDLMDEEFLEAMHTMMDCREVVVAIPNAHVMLACPRDMALGLSPVAEQQYADLQSQGKEVLTPLILSVIDGKLRGFLDMGEVTEDFPGSDTEET